MGREGFHLPSQEGGEELNELGEEVRVHGRPFRGSKCKSGSPAEDFGGNADLFLQRTVSIRSIL